MLIIQVSRKRDTNTTNPPPLLLYGFVCWAPPKTKRGNAKKVNKKVEAKQISYQSVWVGIDTAHIECSVIRCSYRATE